MILDTLIELGEAYLRDEDGEENRYKAFECFKKANKLDAENVDVLDYLGMCYFTGIGVDPSIEKARYYYNRAALIDPENAAIAYHCALVARACDDMDDYALHLCKAIINGHMESAYLLGKFYEEGLHSGEKNLISAELFYRKAAMAGHVKAQYACGLLHRKSDLPKKDEKLAVEMFTQAADSGHADAMFELGFCYLCAAGVDLDVNKGEQLIHDALSREGISPENICLYAKYRLEIWDDRKGFFDLHMKAAEAGLASSQAGVGELLLNGVEGVVEKNEEEGLKWLEKAFLQGDESAKKTLEVYAKAHNIHTNDPPTPQKRRSGCYVATAVYGSYDCPEVWTLRRFRDETLAETWYGRAFIKVYYTVSPTFVRWFGDTNWFKQLWRGKLDRLVKKLQSQGVANTPYDDKTY